MEQAFVNSISLLRDDLRRRFIAPVRSVTFYSHLFVAVIGAGGLGVWYTIYMCFHKNCWEPAGISAALFTYFPAVVAAALVTLEQEKQPYLRSFGLISSAFFIAVFAFSVTTGKVAQLVWAIIGAIFAIFFWWAANGDKDCFKDIDPNAATPDPSQPMSGTDKGWKT